MTVCTQDFKVASVLFPIYKPARPVVDAFLRYQLLGLVNMVDVQNAKVRIAALNTLSAETFKQCNLALPIATLLLEKIAILIPVILLAFRWAELGISLLATVVALASMPPAGCMITNHTAILSIANTYTSRACLKFFATVLALLRDRFFVSHSSIIPRLPIYYAIAQKRISESANQLLMPF